MSASISDLSTLVHAVAAPSHECRVKRAAAFGREGLTNTWGLRARLE